MEPAVTYGLYKGDVDILTGVHGTPDGNMLPDRSLFDADAARFGDIPGVRVHNVPDLSSSQISNILSGPGTIIGAFCNSGACLTRLMQ